MIPSSFFFFLSHSASSAGKERVLLPPLLVPHFFPHYCHQQSVAAAGPHHDDHRPHPGDGGPEYGEEEVWCDFSRSGGSSPSGFVVLLQFFVEDPGRSPAGVLTTSPPEVLVSAPPLNLTNDSLFGNREENAAEIKFYLPVSAYNSFQ